MTKHTTYQRDPDYTGNELIAKQLANDNDRANNLAQQTLDFQKDLINKAQISSASEQERQGRDSASKFLEDKNLQQQAQDFYKNIENQQQNLSKGNQAIGGSYSYGANQQSRLGNLSNASGYIPNTQANNAGQPYNPNNPIVNKLPNQNNEQSDNKNQGFYLPKNMPKLGGY
jgi:hypothetical protein